MKVNFESPQMRDALARILTVVDKKNSRPILTNCLIVAQVENSQLTITGSDLEVSAKILITANVEKSGSFCINSKNLYDILKELPDTTVDLELVDNTLNLTCKSIRYSLLITSSEEYPDIYFEKEKKSFSLNSQQLLNIINKTSYAISTDETRLFLNGIFLQQIDDKLRAVAIDGHRLAMLDTQRFEGDSSSIINGVIVPRKGIQELKKMVEYYPDQEINFYIDNTFININTNNDYFLNVRLISRDYPRYQTVIPTKAENVLRVNREELTNSVKRIKLLSNEKNRGIKFTLEKNNLIISANHNSLGHAIETLNTDYSGVPMDIGFNAKYLLDSLSVLSDETVEFRLNNNLTPAILKSDTDPNYLGIVMPLKL